MFSARRVVLSQSPFQTNRKQAPWERGRLDANFLKPANGNATFSVHRLEFSISQSEVIRVHVSADERYELYLDGELIGRGPERCTAEIWFFETFDFDLAAGNHVFSVVHFAVGHEHAPAAQHSVQPGFLLVADDPKWKSVLTTGFAAWKSVAIDGIEFISKTSAMFVGDRHRFRHGGAMWNAILGKSDLAWLPSIKGEKPAIDGGTDLFPARTLHPALLPAQMNQPWTQFKIRQIENVTSADTASIPYLAKNHLPSEVQLWSDFLDGKMVTIPPKSRRRVLVDFEDYACTYWHLTTSGGKGSKVRLHWQESLYRDLSKSDKGNRNDIEGKFFGMVWWKVPGNGDEILPAGGNNEKYSAHWWLAGRYLEIFVETGDEPLVLNDFQLTETRFPLEPSTAPFICNDDRLNDICKVCLRTLQMDLHETFCDSPYYEQLMYVGDTRIEAKMTMMLADEFSAARRATQLFQWSIGSEGWTQARYPSRVKQFIPPFSLWWVMMVADQNLHRHQPENIQKFLIGVRSVLAAFEVQVDKNPQSTTFGLFRCAEHWNFLDWITEWPFGVPPGGEGGFSIPLNLQLLLAIEAAAELESQHGFAQSHRHLLVWASELRKAIKRFVDADGYLVDSPDTNSVCEHSHILAILSNDPELNRIGARYYEMPAKGPQATYYFQHYRFEALAKLRQKKRLLDGIREDWGKMLDLGLVCTLEQPEPSRSDCHAWAAHPLYHLQTKIAGLMPQDATRYEFTPDLVDLEWCEASVHTGLGAIHVRIDRKADSWTATMVIPEGITISIPAVKGMVVGPRTVTIDPS